MKTTFEISNDPLRPGRIAHVVYEVTVERRVTTAPNQDAVDAIRQQLEKQKGAHAVRWDVVETGAHYVYTFVDETISVRVI